MTGSVKVLVDSTAGISADLAERWGVGVVPLYLTWDGQTYRDGIDFLPTSFYAMLAERGGNPKTSAPSPADFITSCDSALAEGYQDILIITLTPNMSAVYANACLAAKEFSAARVAVLDSGQGAGAQALIAACAARCARNGANLSEVMAAGQAACGLTEIFMAVDTLSYLHRSGRISLTRTVLGEIIQLKPILTFVDHRLQVIAKPRTMRRASHWLLDRLSSGAQSVEQVLVMYADKPDVAVEFAEEICQRVPGVEIDISPVSGVVGGNTGPGLLGLAVRWGPPGGA